MQRYYSNAYMDAEKQDAINLYAVLNFSLSKPLYAIWYDTDNNSMIGPPSEEALTKLRSLRDDYGWAISPNP